MKTINYSIIIADDHKMIASGIHQIIETKQLGSVVSIANNGLELLELLQKNIPNLVILDINMPVLNGIEAAEKITSLYPNLPILILSQYQNESLINKFKKSGIKGYLTKNFDISQLIEAVETIKLGGLYFPTLKEMGIDKNSICLSPREIEILKLLDKGFSSKEISKTLFLSEHTVNTHKKNCLRKLESNSTITMINKAKDLGILF